MLRKAISVLIPLALLATSAQADTLIMEGINPAAIEQPDRGASKDQVRQAYGEPKGRSGPVGEPPISSWEYEPFVVFFEYDRVLHTVAKR